MISLEQVQLLEVRVSKAIDYVERVTAENAALNSEKMNLQTKLDVNQKRIDELEVLVMRFKEDQGRIEDGIIAALDRLNQFEEAFENSLTSREATGVKKPAAKVREKPAEPASNEIFFEIPEAAAEKAAVDNDISSDGELDIF